MINVEHYRKRLLELRKQFDQRRQRDLEAARDVASDVQPADVSQIDETVNEEFTQAELSSAILQQIDEALQRIDDGTYGKCVICGRPIGTKRLDAVPWTPYCAKDQALIEAAGQDRHWTL